MNVKQALKKLADLNPGLDKIEVVFSVYGGSNEIDVMDELTQCNTPDKAFIYELADHIQQRYGNIGDDGGYGTIILRLRPTLGVEMQHSAYETVENRQPNFELSYGHAPNVLDNLFNIV